MRLRRSRALVVVYSAAHFRVINYLQRKEFVCDGEVLNLLAESDEWREEEDFFRAFPQHRRRSVAREIGRLLTSGALIAEGTPHAEEEHAYEQGWVWGETAALYHFSIKNSQFLDGEAAAEVIRRHAAVSPSPQLFSLNIKYREVRALPKPTADLEVFRVMSQRRTERNFAPMPLSLEQLATILFTGFGLTGSFRDPVLGVQPVKMTPSGGARNPYESFVYVNAVTGLRPAIYHYSGMEHSLGLAVEPPLPPISKILGNQSWFDDAAAVVLLVANFDRTAWKYRHPNSYRVVLIEAGHIGQNIALCAAAMGIGAAPTCAIHDEPVERMLGLDTSTQAVVYAYAIGHRDSHGRQEGEKAEPPGDVA